MRQRIERGVNRLGVRHIGAEGGHIGAFGVQAGAALHVPVDHRDAHAFIPQPRDDSTAYAACAAGDDESFAPQPAHGQK